MSPRAALSGSLEDLPLPELLPLVMGTGQAGVVELSGSASGLVVLDGGGITLALADDGPTLQQVVIGSGLASSDTWERAQLASLRGAPLADALVREGVEADRLEAVLREQTIGALFGFLVPAGTDFAFLPGATHPLGARFPFAATEVLREAQARVDAWKVVAEVIPSVSKVMRLARELPTTAVTVEAADWRVLSRVDGRTTIADISRELGMSGFTVCAVLHRLVLAGTVEPLNET